MDYWCKADMCVCMCIRGLFKYECKQLHNFLHRYATTKCHTFLKRTICCLLNGLKHKETLNIFLELQTLICRLFLYTEVFLKQIAMHVLVHVRILCHIFVSFRRNGTKF